MKKLFSSLVVAGLVLAPLTGPAVAFADTAGISLKIGDLSTPGGAKSFDQQVERAADRICMDDYAAHDVQSMMSCKKSVKEEAFANLSPAQRQAYAVGSHVQSGGGQASNTASGVRTNR